MNLDTPHPVTTLILRIVAGAVNETKAVPLNRPRCELAAGIFLLDSEVHRKRVGEAVFPRTHLLKLVSRCAGDGADEGVKRAALHVYSTFGGDPPLTLEDLNSSKTLSLAIERSLPVLAANSDNKDLAHQRLRTARRVSSWLPQVFVYLWQVRDYLVTCFGAFGMELSDYTALMMAGVLTLEPSHIEQIRVAAYPLSLQRADAIASIRASLESNATQIAAHIAKQQIAGGVAIPEEVLRDYLSTASEAKTSEAHCSAVIDLVKQLDVSSFGKVDDKDGASLFTEIGRNARAHERSRKKS